jgi:hypothetical protein
MWSPAKFDIVFANFLLFAIIFDGFVLFYKFLSLGVTLTSEAKAECEALSEDHLGFFLFRFD